MCTLPQSNLSILSAIQELVEKGAEAASEAQENVLLSAALPKALGAGCAMNRFFNKLLDQRLLYCAHSDKTAP
jgi:hypothetical protein